MDGVKSTWESGSGCIAMNPLATGDILKYPHIFNAIRIREAQNETPYCSEELQEVGLRLKKRIESCSLKERIEAGKLLRQRPYILREEVAALMGVYPLSV